MCVFLSPDQTTTKKEEKNCESLSAKSRFCRFCRRRRRRRQYNKNKNKNKNNEDTYGRSKRREESDRSRDRVGGGVHVEISAFRGDDDERVVYAMHDQHGRSVVV